MNNYVLIVAGGKGKRMNSDIPKQFMNIHGRPILMHTIESFYDYSKDFLVNVVLPEPFIDFWQSLCKRYDFNIKHETTIGGDSRFHSVKNGLQQVQNDSLVAIHDGVRPLVSRKTIKNVLKTAQAKGNAIPAVKINESVRQLNADSSFWVNRKNYRLIQTPQCFRSSLIQEAYDQPYREEFTDDASVVEALGVKINLVEGNFENIKITRPVDLKIAQAFLK